MKLWHRSLAALGAIYALAGCAMGGDPALQGAQMAAQALAVQTAHGTVPRVQARLHFRSLKQLSPLEAHGVDLFENVDTAQGTVDALVTPQGQAYLRQIGMPFDLQMNAMAAQLGFPKGYQTVDQLAQDLQSLAVQHPNICHLQIIGHSLENRPIYAMELTSKPGAGLPAIRLQSGQHARELPPVEVMSRLLHALVNGYGSDATLTQLVDTRDIWIVPMVNPDGRVRVEQGQSMWRKNARHLSDGDWGVDTNRNADDHFSEGDKDTSADDYSGPAAFSEPETQAIRDLCAKVNFGISLDLHCYAGMILWPPGYDDSLTKDDAAFHRLGDPLAKSTGYKAGTIATTIYNTYGDVSTWEYDAHNTLAFAVELNDPNFNPPFSQVDKDWAAWQKNLIFLINAAGSPRG